MDIGSIVTVLSGAFEGAQGEVVEDTSGLSDGKIPVMINKAYDHLIGFHQDDEGKIIRVAPEDLRQDPDWKPEIKAIQLFGRNTCHNLSVLKEPFKPGGECACEGCPEGVTLRIMVNICGSVIEYDVCDKHREQYHGKMVDDFPIRKK